MENTFLIGDTVKTSWNGWPLLSLVLKEIEYYSPAIPGVRGELTKPSRYLVEMNFKRTSIKNDDDILFPNGISTVDAENLSTCRMVLIEKAIELFDGRYS